MKNTFLNKESADERRSNRTLAFLSKHIESNTKILDLGVANKLSERMKQLGYDVSNTQGENLDVDYCKYLNLDVEAVTAFEIFEHMLAPFNILRELKTEKLVASVPLKLWFANAYWNDKDEWDKHYHEFEERQFGLLLERTGWKIIDSQRWTSAEWKLGVRPIMRHFFPRYYIVYCERV